MKRIRTGVALLTLALATATDSAGQVGGEPPSARALSSPVLRIGVVAGPEEEQLFRVRDAFRLPDGRIVLANAGTSEVRVYAPDGRFVVGTGGEGDGPGDFQGVDWVAPYRGDSLAVFDSRLSRVTILPPPPLDATGGWRHARTIALGDGAGVASAASGARLAPLVDAVAPFSDGAFLARVGGASARPGDTTAVLRDTIPYVRLDGEGGTIDTVAVLPDSEHFRWAEEGSRSVRPRAFGRTTSLGVHQDRVYVADNSAFRVRVLSSDGTPVMTMSSPRPARPVERADRDAWTARELERLGEGLSRRIGEPTVRAMRFPESFPFHGDLVVGQDGRVWLEEYAPPDREGGRSWTVFTPDGEVADRVTIPDGFRPTWASDSHLLGIATDALGVERIEVYEIG